MQITKEWLKEQSACAGGYEWSIATLKGKPMDSIKFIKILMKEKRYDWANWVIVRVMEYDQYVSYAVYAAEQVIDIYEKKYPDDKRPRLAIEAAKKCIGLKGDAARAAAWAAAGAAWDAAGAAWDAAWAAGAARAAARDAWDAAGAAWDAAWAAGAARAAARAARAAARAAWDAAWAAGAAAGAAGAAARNNIQTKILNHGIKLLKG